MKKLSQVLFIALLAIVGCSKNEAVNTTSEQIAAIKFEGIWTNSKNGKIVNNQEVLTDYVHTPNCTKDFLEIKADGTGSFNAYSSSSTPCQLFKDNITYIKKDNNNYTFTDGPDSYNVEIVKLTLNELKIKYTSGESELFTR